MPAAQAYQGYREIARYLREDYAPRAAETDGVGAQRYAIAARLSLGADLDAAEAYEWGWAELARIEAEMAAEADEISPGAGVAEASALLDQTQYVTGTDAYLAWLQDRHARRSRRPGRRGQVRDLAGTSTVFHEGVPGHHLQVGETRMAGDRLSRFARYSGVTGHSEGWALYAERLADELGWFSEPGTRLGMLSYKLGERGWLAARDEASRRQLSAEQSFDLKRWHTAALNLGPIGLAGLSDALAAIPDSDR